jgi:hypothetical protein
MTSASSGSDNAAYLTSYRGLAKNYLNMCLHIWTVFLTEAIPKDYTASMHKRTRNRSYAANYEMQ